MITSNQIRIEADDDMTLLQKYDKRLRSLILTPEGTMIGNRDFGIDFDLISMQPIQAANFLAMQLERKITRYIPEIKVISVDTETDSPEGRVIFRIRIGRA
jgi:phage baseplate assembly protein W